MRAGEGLAHRDPVTIDQRERALRRFGKRKLLEVWDEAVWWPFGDIDAHPRNLPCCG
jgi:hypothetical protein